MKLKDASKHISSRDFSDHMYQLGLYISAGFSPSESLEIMKSGEAKRSLRKHFSTLQTDLNQGKSFADALCQRYPKQFKPFMASMLRSADQDETADVLLKIGAFQQSIQVDTSKLKISLFYPLIVIGAAIILCAVLMVFVVPVFETMFASFGSALPAPTRLVIDISNFFKQHAPILILLAAVFTVLSRQLDRSWRLFNSVKTKVILRLPYWGRTYALSSAHIFLRTILFLLKEGFTLEQALEAAYQTADKKYDKNIINALKTKVGQGESLSKALQGADIFPIQMASIAAAIERSEKAVLPFFDRLADQYQNRITHDTKKASTIIGPLVVIIIGVFVGFIVISMYLPIFMMAGAV